MTFALKRTGDADYPRHIKALVLGPPKSGKTTFIATFPNVVVADVEAGLMSIAHLDIPYVTIDSSDKLENLKMILGDDTLRAKAAESMGMDKIETVAIDTLDALQELLKKERLARERRESFEQKDWGWLLDQFRETLRAFMALPLHVIMTVHTKTTQDDQNRIISMPGLQGSIAEEIAGYVGFSMLMSRTREVSPTGDPYTKYSLQVEGDERNPHLGNRAAGRLSANIEPDFKHLHAAVYPPDLELRETKPPTEITSTPADQPAAGGESAEPAQSTGQVQQPSAPPDDSEEMITEGALTHLKKMYEEWGYVLPTNAKEWTLHRARDIGRFFVATKEDVAQGQTDKEKAEASLREYLKGVGAWQEVGDVVPDGTVPEVLAWVGDDPGRAQKALDSEKEGKGRSSLTKALQEVIDKIQDEHESSPSVTQEEGEAESPQEQTDVQTPDEPAEAPEVSNEAVSQDSPEAEGQEVAPEEAQAIQNLEDGLGAEVTSEANSNGKMDKADLMRLTDIAQAPPCEVTGNPVDDLDIAKLSLSRYDKWLSVDAYLKHMKSTKA